MTDWDSPDTWATIGSTLAGLSFALAKLKEPVNRRKLISFLPLVAMIMQAQFVAAVAADSLPPFTVAGQWFTALALLVPKDTTNEQLKALILGFRSARQNNALRKLIPPTTPKGSAGPYGIVVVYVFSDPSWATTAALKRCSTQVRGNTPAYAECSRQIRAYYFYGAQPSGGEEGSVGYAEGKRVYTKFYEKLF